MATEKRLKSKMKRSDPENFTIHDFLGECKTVDTAESRFDESLKSARGQRKYFVLGAPAMKLGNLYREVGDRLAHEKGWAQKKDDTGRFHLILGGPRGNGIPFKRFAQLFKWDYGITPHCNYFRGHVWLTQKVKLAQVLRQAKLEHVMPETFLYFPSSAEDNETEDFRIACESTTKRASKPTWIAKPADASKGERTLISDDFDEILGLLDSQDRTTAAWSIQRYISNPLLLPGSRKFDLRFYVLVDAKLRGYLSTQATLKACSAPFSMDNLSDMAAHISHPAVQGKAVEDFPIEQFAKWIASEHNTSFETIFEQAKDVITQVLDAAKEKLENVEHADFTSFQVFAFDFIVDADLKVWFLEVSSPSEFPQELTKDFASDILEIAIKPTFAEQADGEEDRGAGPVPRGVLFQPLEAGSASRQARGNNKK